MKSTFTIYGKFIFCFLIALIFSVFGSISNAQVLKSFTQRSSVATPGKLIYNIKGDYTMIGNTNLTVQPYGVNTNNSNNTMVYVDVDGDPNTINSSSATLGFSTENGAIPACSNIIYAGLYWTGRAADGGPSPETFSVTTTTNQSLPVNQNYTVTNGNSIQYTDYTMAVTRVGSNNSYGVRYTFTSSGAGPQVLFEFLFAGPPYIRYSTDNGSTWTNPTNQVVSSPGTNLSKVVFDPVTVYAPGGGIILTVNSLVRDNRGNQSQSSYQNSAIAYGHVGGTAIVPVTTSKSLNKRTVSLKGPGQANYTQFIANAGDIYYPDGVYGNMYSSYVEITSYVKANGIGNYTVADLALIEGNGGATGYYGGWGMIVVYENSKMKWRDVTIFDGHAYVVGGTAQFDLPVSGFHTAQSGAINMKLGMMAGEGDVGISGDYFKIRNYQNTAWVDLSHSGNSTTNFFNSSVNTGGNLRNPSFQNNTGVDIAMFNIPNAGNSVVTNNQTSTSFQYGSTQDTYIIFCIAMAVDAYVPDVELLVSTTYINGVPVGGGPLSALPGQDIEYKLEVKNLGTEAINNTKFVVPLPYTTTYVAGSSSVTINFAPAPSPNTVTFDPLLGSTGSIVWDFGTLPLPALPSTLLATMTFHFKVTTDCNILKNPDCPPNVTLSGGVTSGTGATSGLSFSNMPFIQGYQTSGGCIGEPITDPLVIAIDGAAYVAANCASTPDHHAFVFCNYTLPTIPVTSIAPSFPVGLRFFNTNNVTPTSIEYDVNNPFPATSGVHTYFAIPIGINLCYYTFTIAVSNLTTVPTASNVIYCLNDFAAPLTATASNPTYTLNYYTSLVSTTPSVSITPSTAIAGVTTYYVAEVEPLSLGGCVSSNRLPITVTVHDFNASITSHTDVYCNGGNTGAATVTATGGSGNYAYSWSTIPVKTTATVTGLIAGNYTVTVSDNNGCGIVRTATVSITQPASALAASITAHTDVYCNGGNTGTATVTATGGSGSYSYSWNTTPAQTTAIATGLSALNYMVTVTDNNGCAVPKTATVSITQPASAMNASITSHTDVYCKGGNTGSATVTATGGSGVYSYSWNTIPVQTTATATGLSATNYTVTVTDNNGCVIPTTATVSITQPTFSLTASIIAHTDVYCNGGNTGAATAAATGGSGVYFYFWNTTPVQTTAIATGLSAANYTVTVTDANGCVIPKTATITITQPTFSLSATITAHTDVYCNGGNTGAATVTATGGSGSYSYSWNTTPVQTTASATGLSALNYMVTVADANGCLVPKTATVSISQPALTLGASITAHTDVYCKGGNTGSATVTATGGSGVYSYSWNTTPVQTTATATGLIAANYTVTVTDNNGCLIPKTATISITQPTFSLTASITAHTDVYCKGGTTGAATVTASGGSGLYAYSWSTTPVQTSITATGLSATNYTVTVTDNNGCLIPKTVSVSITEPAIILGASITSQTNVFCNGGNTASATVTATGGSGVYSYSWNTTPVQTTVMATGLSALNYIVTVTDNNGCTLSATATATITQPAALTSTVVAQSYNGQNISCNGLSNGSIDLTVAGGTTVYTYAWSNAQTTQDISGLNAGTYSVLVTDAHGCTTSKTITLTQPLALTTTITPATFNGSNVSCNGSNNGGIDLSVAGGTLAYTYAWSNAQVTQDITNLTAGTYSVFITDKNGCTTTASVTLTQPLALTTTITPATFNGSNVSCNGSNNGGIDLSVAGGTLAYTYAWSNAQTTQDIANLTAGTYSVLVTDKNGCITTASVTLTQPAALTTTITPATFNGSNVSCFGSSNGNIDLTVAGGTTAYTYGWSNSMNTQDISNITSGTYSVLVTDKNGCTTTASVTLTQPLALTTTVVAATYSGGYNISCMGLSNGSINLSVAGGTLAYTYAWSNAQVTQDITNLSAGTYSVLVTDKNGCTTTNIVTLTQPNTFTTTVVAATYNGGYNISCNGLSNGSIDLTVTGGTIPYTYGWSNAQTTQDISGLNANTYSVLVTDQNGCAASASITLTQPAAITTTVTTAIYNGGYNISCNGLSDGSVDLTVSGGTLAYTYTWSNAQVTQDITNLTSGTYSVLVTDMNGCTATNTITLAQPVILTNTISISSNYNGQNISCNGLSDGSIDLTVAGGTTSYTYAWTNTSQTTEDITGLNANTYAVLVTDANGCTTTNTVTLMQPLVLTTTIAVSSNFNGQNISCNGLSDGSIDLTVAGGTTNYTYIWTNTSQTTEDITGLSANPYSVLITDMNGCTTTNTITINEPALLSSTIAVSSNYNGQNISCNGLSNGSIDLSVSGGTTAYTYAWSNTQTTQDISGLNANTYSVLITDVNGCTATNAIIVTEPAILTAFIAVTSNYNGQNISCYGLSNANLDLTVAGGTTNYTYFWSTAATTEDISGVSANNYFVLVTDVNGCTSTSSVSVTQPVLLTNTIAISSNYNSQNISCNGLNNGSIDLSVAGGTTAYTYAWSNAETTQDISGLNANTYSVLVTDVNGCTTTNTITLTQPVLLTNTIAISSNYNGQNITCNGQNTGSVDLTVAGGTTAYTYAWSNAETTQDISGLAANTYSVLITDVNGCTTTNTITLTQPAALSGTIAISSNYNGQNISCNGMSNGSIDLSVAGGTTAYTYAWSNGQTTQDISGLNANNYSVLILDANGCTTTETITVTEPAPLTSIITFSTYYNGYNINCNGNNNGGIALTVLGGTSAYSYNWSNGATTQNITGLSANTYSVFVTDMNGCATTNSLTLTQPTSLSTTIAVSSNYYGQNVSCFGSSNGSIDLNVAGGTPLYTYSWSNGQTTQDISGLSANTYTVVVTDANGCSLTNTIVVTEPALLTSTVASANVLCYGGNTGTASVAASGGTMPYTYLWSPNASNQTTKTATGLSIGTYTILVTDINGCTSASTVTISQPQKLTDSTFVFDALCNGSSNGSASAILAGGTVPYNYIWSNGQTTTSISGLSAGQYIITATDNNGCGVTDTAIVGQPGPLADVLTVSNVLCHGDSSGAVSVTMSGGTTPYSYLWNNSQTTSSVSGLPVGSYSVTVTDSNGCILMISVSISQPNALIALITPTAASCSGSSNGTALVSIIGGVTPYTYQWSANAGSQTTQLATGLASGDYSITITDANGCVLNDSVKINDNSPVTLFFNKQDASCYGSANGTIDLTVAGGVLPYSYLWSTGATTEDLAGLSTGTFIVSVLDSNMCGKNGIVIIDQPDSISATYISTLYANGFNITLHGAADGYVDLTVTGGTNPYSYFWSTGNTTEDLSFVPAGDYYVQVTDSNGCNVILSLTLTEPFELQLPTGISPNGDGLNDYFVIHGLESYPDNELSIYNRWGNLVYSQDDYKQNWSGRNNNGDDLPVATYFVVLKIFGTQEITLTGYVDLRR